MFSSLLSGFIAILLSINLLASSAVISLSNARAQARDAREAPVHVRSADIISQESIHWHPHLSIVINGKPFDIPADIGLGTVHEPLHTHDRDGIIHIEYGAPDTMITKQDVTLGKFFKIWGKQFNQKCIFNNCNGSGGTVQFRVNGQKNTEFDNYVMHDEDQIEIVYE